MKFVDLALISVSVLIVACGGDDPEPAPSGTPAASSNVTNTVTSGATSGGSTQTSGGTLTAASTVAGNTAATTGGGTVTGTTTGDMTGVGGSSTVGTVTGDGSTATGGSTSGGGSTGTTSDTTGTTTAGDSTGAGGSMGGTDSGGGLVAVATITPTTAAPSGWDDFSATATFTQEGDMVTLVIEATGCPDGPHIAHLHANHECGADGEAAGPHWIPNGEVLEDMLCESGTGSYTHSESTDVWSIGGDAETDITQHSYMVHALSAAENAGAKAACGSINAQ